MFNDGGSRFQMFESAAFGGQNLLFKDSTTELVPILEQTYQAWLGDEYLHAMRGLDCDPQSTKHTGGGSPKRGTRGSRHRNCQCFHPDVAPEPRQERKPREGLGPVLAVGEEGQQVRLRL